MSIDINNTDNSTIRGSEGNLENAIVDFCPCGSGLEFRHCCGSQGRNAVNAPVLATLTMNGVDAAENLTAELRSAIDIAHKSPDLFPARINFFEGKAYFVKMSLRWYRESVFLDPARLKGTCVIASDLDWLWHRYRDITWQATGYIFHTAFCGSTLMSQALAVLYNSLPLREPEVLGNLLVYLRSAKLNLEEYAVRVQQILNLLSRRYQANQPAVVKANDYANPLMPVLLNLHDDIPVLFMYTPLAEFLAGCLKADNRREWIKQRFQAVQQFAPQMLEWPQTLTIDDNAYGEMAAVYWSYNIAQFLEARDIAPRRIRSLDFNDMLADPLRTVRQSAEMFHLQQSAGVDPDTEIENLFGVYSKNSKFKYSPQQRKHDIQRLLEEQSNELQAAERLARELLGSDYPETKLPNNLIDV